MPTVPLDIDRLEGNVLGARVDWHATLPSTNDRALALAASAELPRPVLILAGEQTAGRGRRENRWWSSTGALTFSLLFDPATLVAAPLTPELWPRIALVAGLSWCETIDPLLRHAVCALKWPNDVLLNGRKVAGILVEVPAPRTPEQDAASDGSSRPRPIVLGMGINVNNSFHDAPPEIARRALALCEVAGRPLDVSDLLLRWCEVFSDNLIGLARHDGELPARWRSRCVLASRQVELQAGGGIVRGQCRGIDDEGALVLETTTGTERCFGGTIVSVSD